MTILLDCSCLVGRNCWMSEELGFLSVTFVVGDKRSITRFGEAFVPFELCAVVVDACSEVCLKEMC